MIMTSDHSCSLGKSAYSRFSLTTAHKAIDDIFVYFLKMVGLRLQSNWLILHDNPGQEFDSVAPRRRSAEPGAMLYQGDTTLCHLSVAFHVASRPLGVKNVERLTHKAGKISTTLLPITDGVRVGQGHAWRIERPNLTGTTGIIAMLLSAIMNNFGAYCQGHARKQLCRVKNSRLTMSTYRLYQRITQTRRFPAHSNSSEDSTEAG